MDLLSDLAALMLSTPQHHQPKTTIDMKGNTNRNLNQLLTVQDNLKLRFEMALVMNYCIQYVLGIIGQISCGRPRAFQIT